jgi:hypothetical protein
VTDEQPGDTEDRVRDAYRSAARTVQTLQRTSAELDAPVPRARPRRMNAFVPIAAAAAVIVVIAASLAVPRLLAGSAGNSQATATPTPGSRALRSYPPFQVVLTVNDSNRESKLQVESAATGRVLSTLAPPWQGATWGDIAATQDATKFIVAAAPSTSPYAPTRLYTLALSARGAVAGLRPLAVPSLPGELTSLAASADGSTIAYSTLTLKGGIREVGVITGGRKRQWNVPYDPIVGVRDVSVSGDGQVVAVATEGLGSDLNEQAVWVLRTDSAPGSFTARARKVYDHSYIGGAGHAYTLEESDLISPDGGTLYLCLAHVSAGGKTVTTVTAVDTADGASLGTIASWDSAYPTTLTPVAGLPLVWDPGSFEPYSKKPDPTAYLLDPGARTSTTLRLHGIPRAQYLTLAW